MKTANACLLLCLVLITASCRTSGPGETYISALMAANEGKYAEADRYLGSGVGEAISALGTMAAAFNVMWNERTRHGTIQRIEVLKEDIQGARATVTCDIHFKDGSIQSKQKVEMKKENGRWKLIM